MRYPHNIILVRLRIIESEIGGYDDDGSCKSREFKHEVVVLDAIYEEDYTNEYVYFIDLCLEQGGRLTRRNNVAPIVWPSESESQENSELVLVAI